MSILKKIKNIITFRKYRKKPSRIENHIKDLREIILSYQTKLLQLNHKNKLNSYGKKCFSQTDEDGITIEILKRIDAINNGTFVEFGVGDGTENNTLILKALGWDGCWIGSEELIIDSKNTRNFSFINQFVTLKNIIPLIKEGLNIIEKDKVDVISFDLDGNDYYLLDELLKNNFKPKLFIVEYNAKFPPPVKWKIDYNENHVWEEDDYYGASLSSLNDLFEQNDYQLICCNAHTGANAFFIRKEYKHLFEDVPKKIEDIYVEPRYYLHSRDPVTKLNYFGHVRSIKTINKLFK